ncbi:unnamed protein product [Closterium sp. NIES-54]
MVASRPPMATSFLPDKIAVLKLLEGRHDLNKRKETIEPKLEIPGLKKFVDGNVETPDKEDVHLLTFVVISRRCTLMVQVVLKPCGLHVDADFQAWRCIVRIYQATDDVYIGQFEQRFTNIRMGKW